MSHVLVDGPSPGWASVIERNIRPALTAEPGHAGPDAPLLLLLADRPALADSLASEAEARGLRIRATTTRNAFLDAVREDAPAVLLIDLDALPEEVSGAALVGETTELVPSRPVLVATATPTLARRAAAARAGCFGLLRKPLSPGQVLVAAISALRRTDVAGCRLLVVDNDEAALADLGRRLAPLRVEVTALPDARRFLAAMEAVRPHAVFLDIGTRYHSGLELCRVLRADERWAALPVAILADEPGPAATHLAFLAGADDVIAKPFVTAEIVTRLGNRLERQRYVRERAGRDPLTGALALRGSEEALQSLIRLAARVRQPFSLAVLNVDALRTVNETCGHATGDAALRRVAHLLRDSFRFEDHIGRMGGDQFIVGAFGLEKDDCVARLQHVARRLGEESFGGGGCDVRVGFSAGVSALYQDGSDLAMLRHAAEDTLALAKSMGPGTVLPGGWTPGRTKPTRAADVILIERDPALAGLLLHAIEQTGWSVRWFRSGSEAMDELCGAYPNLRGRVVLLDTDLEGDDGFTVLRALGRDDVLARTRVIMLTNGSTETETLEAFELGACDQVARPFSMPVLLQRIRRAMHGLA